MLVFTLPVIKKAWEKRKCLWSLFHNNITTEHLEELPHSRLQSNKRLFFRQCRLNQQRVKMINIEDR